MQGELLPREITPTTVLMALRGRLGEANGGRAQDIVRDITGRDDEALRRQFRQVVEQLRREGHPICSTTDAGYWWAASPEDLDRACRFLVDRAMTSLSQVAAMKRVALPDLYGQLGLEIDRADETP